MATVANFSDARLVEVKRAQAWIAQHAAALERANLTATHAGGESIVVQCGTCHKAWRVQVDDQVDEKAMACCDPRLAFFAVSSGG